MPLIALSPRALMPGVRNCARTFCCLLTLFGFLTIANAQNNLVGFDGTDDYIDCGNDPMIAATNIKTMECWVKFGDFSPSGARAILSKSTLGQGFELILFNAQLGLFIMGGGSESNILYSTSGMIADTWYHIAGSWDGATKESMKLYVNGVSVGSLGGYNDINVSGITDPANNFKIGRWTDPGGFGDRSFYGSIDEVRVWSTERTPSEIKAGMYGTVSTGATDLIAYYKLNEGTGTTAANSTANTGLDGTLINGPTWATSPVQAGNNSISLDGVDDYVSIPTLPAYDFTSGTIECRIKPASVTATNDCFIASRDGGGKRYSFHINTTGIYFDNGTSTQTVPATFNAGTSYLISLVTNSSNIDAYVDGVLAGTFTQTFGAATGKPVLIGSPDGVASNAENFEGSVDEVRFWSTERTALEITGSASNLAGNEAGLIGLFNFNQGVSEGDNSGLRVVVDGTTANNHGTLFNLALTGTSSNFITGLVVLPVRLTAFSLAKSGQNVVVKWQTSQEQNSLKFEVERSSDGSSFAKIGSVAAAGNSSTPKDYSLTDYTAANGKNFYRLKQIDLDGKSVYTTVKVISISANDKLSWSLTGDRSVVVSLLRGANEKYQLIDISGRALQKGTLNNGRVTLSNLRSGRYTVVVDGKERMVIGFIVP